MNIEEINVEPLQESLLNYNETANLLEEFEILKAKSALDIDLDIKPFIRLEKRCKNNPIKGGMFFKSPFRVANHHSSCQQCLYAFEVDTYGRGCTHDCMYCYARDILRQRDYWNNPMPAPVKISDLWKVFYTVFETNKPNKYRSILEKRIPIRIGSMSDSFMGIDRQYKVTQALLDILNFYKYPYIIFTRSTLIAQEEYLKRLDPKLCSAQISLASLNEKLNKKIEPGAASGKDRLETIEKLIEAGIWSTLRINPCFPNYPDGYFTDPNFRKSFSTPSFDYSSPEIVDAAAEKGVKSILLGMARLSPIAMKSIEKQTGIDLRGFFKPYLKSQKDYHLSDNEVRYYYETYRERCTKNGIQFSTCYIGNGEPQFWRDQDMWSNKKDCCNAIGKVNSFTKSSRDIPWDTRMKHTPYKCTKPNDEKNLHTELGKLHD